MHNPLNFLQQKEAKFKLIQFSFYFDINKIYDTINL